jgi:uncharacterized membrane protein
MSEQDFGSIPPGQESSQGPAAEGSWGSTQPQTPPNGYAAPPSGYVPPPPGYAAQPAATQGLSENSACALAYVTFIPALIFLLVPPYNQSARIRFHAIQELGLSVIWACLGFILIIPFLGWLIGGLGFLCLLVMWILCIMKASQGGAFKLPVIGDFAAQQSGYRP